MRRLLLALYLSPAVMVLLLAIQSGSLGLIIVYPWLLIHLICFGVPLLRLMFRSGLTGWPWSMLAGALSAIPLWLLAYLLQGFMPVSRRVDDFSSSSLAILLGSLLLFSIHWVLGVWRNPALGRPKLSQSTQSANLDP